MASNCSFALVFKRFILEVPFRTGCTYTVINGSVVGYVAKAQRGGGGGGGEGPVHRPKWLSRTKPVQVGYALGHWSAFSTGRFGWPQQAVELPWSAAHGSCCNGDEGEGGARGASWPEQVVRGPQASLPDDGLYVCSLHGAQSAPPCPALHVQSSLQPLMHPLQFESQLLSQPLEASQLSSQSSLQL